MQVRASVHMTMPADAMRTIAVEAARAGLSEALSGALGAAEVAVQVVGIGRRPSRFWIDVVCVASSGAVIESGGVPIALPGFAKLRDEAHGQAVALLVRDAAVESARAVMKQAARRGHAELWPFAVAVASRTEGRQASGVGHS